MFTLVLLTITAAVIDCGVQLARFARGTAVLLIPSGRRPRRPWPWRTPAISAAPVRAKIDGPSSPSDGPLVFNIPTSSGGPIADVVPSADRVPTASTTASQLLPLPSTLSPLPTGSHPGDVQLYASRPDLGASPLVASTGVILLALVATPLAVSSKRKFKGRPVSQWTCIVLAALAGVSIAPEHMEPACTLTKVAAGFSRLSSYSPIDATALICLAVVGFVSVVLAQVVFCYVRGCQMLRVEDSQAKYAALPIRQIELLPSTKASLADISRVQYDLQSPRDKRRAESATEATRATRAQAWKRATLHHCSIEQAKIIRTQLAEIENLEATQAALVLMCDEKDTAAHSTEQVKDAQQRELEELKAKIAAVCAESEATQTDLRLQITLAKQDAHGLCKVNTEQLEQARAENASLVAAIEERGSDNIRADNLEAQVAQLRVELANRDRTTARLCEEVEASVRRADDADTKMVRAIAAAEKKTADEAARNTTALQEKNNAIDVLKSRIEELLRSYGDAQVANTEKNFTLESNQAHIILNEDRLKASQEVNLAMSEKISLLETEADKLKGELKSSRAQVAELTTTIEAAAQEAEVAQRVQHRLDSTARGYASHAKLLIVELAKTRMRLHDAQQQSRKSWPDDFSDAMAFLKEKARELIQLREENEELEFRRSQAILLAEGWKDRAQTLEEQLRDERCSIIDASSSGDSDIASLGSGSLATSSIGSISSILRRYEHTVPPIRLLDLPLPSSTSLVSIEGFDPLPALDSHTSSASPVCLADSAKDNPPPTICCSASISLQAPHPRPTAPRAPVVDWCKVESMANEYMLLEQEFERRNANNAVAPDTSLALTTLHSPSSSPSPSTPLTSTSTSPAPSTPPVPSTPPLPIAEPKARVTPVLPFAASPIAQKLPIGELIDAPPMSWAQWAALLDAEEAGNAK